jgi:gamma-glutamyltranspeptidase/glutathione hydrolase
MRNLQAPGRSPVIAPTAMASTSHPLSSQTAIGILQAGGNALDAAIAAAAVQCVVEPGSTSIGGDCFCLFTPAGKAQPIAFNGSGRAPMGLSSDWLMDHGIAAISQSSPHAVTIPGAVDAWVRLNNDHGTLSMSEILAPAIAYARDGYPITQRVSADFAAASSVLDSDGAAVFLRDGKPPQMGMRHMQPALAATMRKIAKQGRDGFYKGSVADDILAKLQSCGGLHTQDDFDRAIGDYVTPIKTNFRGYDVWECPPNGQGMIALQLLNMMSEIDCFGDDPLKVERMHYEIEAGRLAYRDRGTCLADPAFYDVPVETIISPEYAATLRGMIDPARAKDQLPPSPLPAHKSTVYITVIDRDRNACSFINTLYYGFGSGIMAPASGVLLQNRGMGFVVDANHPNRVEPGKRPLHTIIPGMASKQGRTALSFGVMGGDYQAFGHMQLLTRMLDYGMDIQMAQDTPRFFPDPFGDNIDFENTIPAATIAALRERGHKLTPAATPIGGSQAIWIDWDEGLLTGGSDPRKDGCAIGY